MRRRTFLAGAVGSQTSLTIPVAAAEESSWGAAAGFPTGWGSPRGMSRTKVTRVGNYSGGFESMLPFRTIQCGAESPLRERMRSDIKYLWGLGQSTVDDYLAKWPVTGLLIARRGEVWTEAYRFDRNADMRMSAFRSKR